MTTTLVTVGEFAATCVAPTPSEPQEFCSLLVDSVCQQCFTGYSLDTASACVANTIANCEVFTEALGTQFLSCDVCQTGFQFNDAGDCVACGEGCDECESEFTNQWPMDFTYNVANVSQCKAVSSCKKCKNGYLFMEGAGCVKSDACKGDAKRVGDKCQCPKGKMYSMDGEDVACVWENDCYKDIASPDAMCDEYRNHCRIQTDCTRNGCNNDKCV
jgi:hypothetical protein